MSNMKTLSPTFCKKSARFIPSCEKPCCKPSDKPAFQIALDLQIDAMIQDIINKLEWDLGLNK